MKKLTKTDKIKIWEKKYGDKEKVRCRCFMPMQKNKLESVEKLGWDLGTKCCKKDKTNIENLRPLCIHCKKKN